MRSFIVASFLLVLANTAIAIPLDDDTGGMSHPPLQKRKDPVPPHCSGNLEPDLPPDQANLQGTDGWAFCCKSVENPTDKALGKNCVLPDRKGKCHNGHKWYCCDKTSSKNPHHCSDHGSTV